MLKILHTADWHIRDKDIEEQKKCLEFLISTAKQEQPDIIIHAGDVIDQQGIQLDTKAVKLVFRTFSELANIAPVAAILGTPSHEGNAIDVLSHIKARYPIHVSTYPEQIYLCEGDLGNDPSKLFAPLEAPIEAVISMMPAPTKQFLTNNLDIKTSNLEIAGEMSKMFAGFAAQAEPYAVPHILVGHWNITGSLVSETQTLIGVDIELSTDQMLLSNANLKLMGHIHKAQRIGSAKDIFYAGSITGLTWGELDDKGFYIHEISKDVVAHRFIKTPSKKLVRLSKDLTEGMPGGDINSVDDIGISTEIVAIQGACVKLEIKIYQDEIKKINKKEIKESLIEMGAENADIKIISMPRENVRSHNILKLTTLREKIMESAKLRGETVPESILEKADMIETEDADKIVRSASVVSSFFVEDSPQ